MSAPKRTVIFSPQSVRDYDDILLHSLTTWGVEQKDLYRARLDRSLEDLAVFPEIGQTRNDIGEEYRTLRVGQHMIVYRLDATTIWVSRILHSRQDLVSAVHVSGAE